MLDVRASTMPVEPRAPPAPAVPVGTWYPSRGMAAKASFSRLGGLFRLRESPPCCCRSFGFFVGSRKDRRDATVIFFLVWYGLLGRCWCCGRGVAIVASEGELRKQRLRNLEAKVEKDDGGEWDR